MKWVIALLFALFLSSQSQGAGKVSFNYIFESDCIPVDDSESKIYGLKMEFDSLAFVAHYYEGNQCDPSKPLEEQIIFQQFLKESIHLESIFTFLLFLIGTILPI